MKYLVVVLLVIVLLVGCSDTSTGEFEVYDKHGNVVMSLPDCEHIKDDYNEAVRVRYVNATLARNGSAQWNEELDNAGTLYTNRGISIGDSMKAFFEAYKGEIILDEFCSYSILLDDYDKFKDFLRFNNRIMFGTIFLDKGAVSYGTFMAESEQTGNSDYLAQHAIEMYYISFDIADGKISDISIHFYDFEKN